MFLGLEKSHISLRSVILRHPVFLFIYFCIYEMNLFSLFLRAIADECPESSTKKDLIAYLQRIALYCHQLNITSKVKADVQNVSGELIVSGPKMEARISGN